MQNSQENTALVLFRVGPVLCCAPAQPIQSIVAPPKLTRTPGSTDARPGIFHHSEHVVQVSDLRVRFGIRESQRKQPGRLIITQQENGYIAFWVDDIIEVIQSPKEGWGKLPPYIPRGIFSNTLLLNGQIHLYVEIEKLDELPDEDYLSQYLEQFTAGEKDEPERVAETSPQQETSAPENRSEPEPDLVAEKTSSPEYSKTNSDNRQTIPDEVSTVDEPATKASVTEPETSTTEAVPEIISVTDSNAASNHPELQDKTVIESDPADGQVDQVAPRRSPVTVAPTTEAGSDQAAPTIQATAGLLTETKLPDPVITEESRLQESPEPDKSEPKPEPIAVSTTTAQQDDAVSREEKTKSVAATYELHQRHELIPPEKTINKPEPKTRVGIAVAASILLLVSAITAYWLLMPDELSLQHPSIIASSDKLAPTIVTESKKQETVTEESATPLTEQIGITDVVQAEQQESAVTENTTAESETYHAEIKHDAKGVTIEIEAPEDEQVLNKPEPEASTNKESSPQAEPDTKQEESVIRAPDNNDQQIVREITHIVIKGDTLWDIAKHYVNNPYKYRELARLSNIKNPDRIYPGNRVRIVHKSRDR